MLPQPAPGGRRYLTLAAECEDAQGVHVPGHAHRLVCDPEPVAVVLVTYQSAADLPSCLDALPDAAGPHPLEVVVVDNASRDRSAEIARARGLKVLEQPTNLGLSRAINLGVAHTSAPWLLVVNPDARLGPGSLARMVATAADDARIGAVGPRLWNLDGSPYPTGRRFPSILLGALHAALGSVWPTNPATRRYHLADLERDGPARVDWVSGACLLLRREAFEQVGGFDEGYFMYFEELDLCLRLARAGWTVVYDPGAEAWHAVGGSTRSAPFRKVWNHHRSALRFYCRRYHGDPRLALVPLVAAFLALRGLVSLARTAVSRATTRPPRP
jgi:N-acetylglucosaminyl-diphospho-decaprenol L-rhamnosyltransferase